MDLDKNYLLLLETATSWVSGGSYEKLKLYNRRRIAECEIYGY